MKIVFLSLLSTVGVFTSIGVNANPIAQNIQYQCSTGESVSKQDPLGDVTISKPDQLVSAKSDNADLVFSENQVGPNKIFLFNIPAGSHANIIFLAIGASIEFAISATVNADNTGYSQISITDKITDQWISSGNSVDGSASISTINKDGRSAFVYCSRVK